MRAPLVRWVGYEQPGGSPAGDVTRVNETGQEPAENAGGRRFHVHTCLGRGGFGEVYRATMLSAGGVRTEVAIKILRGDIDPGSEAVKRLRDEGRMLGALRHPAILRVHDLVLLEDRVALVTEFVEGGDLELCMRADGLMPVRALMGVIGEVAAALHAAWSTPSVSTGEPIGLVHRDVKPANIRIGKHGQVKLLDFGIARATNVVREAQTADNTMMGSYLYMAPERFHEDAVDPPSDVYALGCVLFEGLSEQRLFDAMTLKQIYGTMLSSRRFNGHIEQRFTSLPAEVPPEVVGLLRNMLHVDAAERPTALQVAQRSEDLVEDLGGPTLKRWTREHPWPPTPVLVGSLQGRHLTAHSFTAVAMVTAEATVDIPRRHKPRSPPAVGMMALPSPGSPLPTDLPSAPTARVPRPTEGAPTAEEPSLPEPGSYFAIDPSSAPEPMPGVLEETPLGASYEDERRAHSGSSASESGRTSRWIPAVLLILLLGGVGALVAATGVLGMFTLDGPDAAIEGPREPGLTPAPPLVAVELPPPAPAEDPAAEEPVVAEPVVAEPAAVSSSVLRDRGWDAVDGGDHAGALLLFEQAVGRGGGDAEAQYGKGYTLMQLGRHDEATNALCIAIDAGGASLKNEIRNIMSRSGLICP